MRHDALAFRLDVDAANGHRRLVAGCADPQGAHVTTSPPGTAVQLQAVVHLANNCIEFAEEVCDSVLTRQTLNPNTNLEGISGACIARGAQALMSTAELAQRGFVGDALTVARTIVEQAIGSGRSTEPRRPG